MECMYVVFKKSFTIWFMWPQDQFSTLPQFSLNKLGLRDFSRFFKSFADIVNRRWWNIQRFPYFYLTNIILKMFYYFKTLFLDRRVSAHFWVPLFKWSPIPHLLLIKLISCKMLQPLCYFFFLHHFYTIFSCPWPHILWGSGVSVLCIVSVCSLYQFSFSSVSFPSSFHAWSLLSLLRCISFPFISFSLYILCVVLSSLSVSFTFPSGAFACFLVFTTVKGDSF